MDALTSASPMSAPDHEAGLQLAGRHAHHLGEMLDALSDVALSRRPTFSAGRSAESRSPNWWPPPPTRSD